MGIKKITTDVTGLSGVLPNIVYIETDDVVATVTAAGYLNPIVEQQGHIFNNKQMALVYTTDSGCDWYQVTVTTTNASLVLNVSPGDVVLPVVVNAIAAFTSLTGQIGILAGTTLTHTGGISTTTTLAAGTTVTAGTGITSTTGNITATAGNVIAGSSGAAGVLRSFPAVAANGNFTVAAVGNAGNFAMTLSNPATLGQATVVTVSDPGAANGFLNTSTVNASTTPVGAFITKTVTLGFAALAAGGNVVIQASAGAQQYKVRDIKVNYGAAGLSGGGGDRLIQITDGTTVYNDAGITAALLGTPVNTAWGGAGNPLPGTVSADTASVAGQNIRAIYAGGAADYTAGSVDVTVALERVA